MPRKSKNSTKRNSNQFELLDDEDDGTNDNVTCGIIVANSTSAADVTRTSARGRPLKPTLQFDPEPRPSRKKSAVPKAKSTNADPNVNEDSLARIEALLKRVEERAERAEKRVESLEEFIRNELFPRVASPPESATPSAPHQQQHQHLPPSPPPSPVPGPLPGIGLDVSRVLDSDIKEGNAGTIRRRANAALEKLGVTCLGVNSKGNGRFRLLFRETDVDKVRQNDTWIKTHFDKGTLYGEQWYPLRVDRAHRGVATDDIGCAVFERMNGVKVHKMRWLGTASVDKEYRSLVVHLDKKEEVDRLLAKRTVEMANGECAYTRPFVQGLQPARCYRCHLYGHLHYRCKAPAPICGQCAQPGHSASTCTSDVFKCAACGGKGAHKATDPGCPVYRRELAKLRPTPY
ncbi:hypothetical protein HIM_10675 [Hirsutella minnesotensis 3608]|uniref:CCHC-type domain-containing protein n=1 Tax=Hirsutella minnesotensis 3608 TaxID=1043627 RepID=A0A0F7ZX16_9HYPO|nr:hypothetical protein HIM_10675 [Hirsutella minnesotensis 3608]